MRECAEESACRFLRARHALAPPEAAAPYTEQPAKCGTLAVPPHRVVGNCTLRRRGLRFIAAGLLRPPSATLRRSSSFHKVLRLCGSLCRLWLTAHTVSWPPPYPKKPDGFSGALSLRRASFPSQGKPLFLRFSFASRVGAVTHPPAAKVGESAVLCRPLYVVILSERQRVEGSTSQESALGF